MSWGCISPALSGIYYCNSELPQDTVESLDVMWYRNDFQKHAPLPTGWTYLASDRKILVTDWMTNAIAWETISHGLLPGET